MDVVSSHLATVCAISGNGVLMKMAEAVAPCFIFWIWGSIEGVEKTTIPSCGVKSFAAFLPLMPFIHSSHNRYRVLGVTDSVALLFGTWLINIQAYIGPKIYFGWLDTTIFQCRVDKQCRNKQWRHNQTNEKDQFSVENTSVISSIVQFHTYIKN